MAFLLEVTGLVLTSIVVGDRTFAMTSQPGLAALPREEFEYLAILRRS